MFFPRKTLFAASLPKKWSGILILACGTLFLSETCSPAASVNISAGLRGNFLALKREGKLSSGQHLRGDSQEEWAPGLALNLNAGRWFFGSDLFSGSANYESGTSKDPTGNLTGRVDITEINMALGFQVFRNFGPFLAFTHHKQSTSGSCPGCDSTFQFSRFGPGLSLSIPFPKTRAGGYMRGSYIMGYNWEAGFSYSAVRLPLMGALGFRQRVISYSPGEVPCHEGVSGCFLTRDVIAGPTASLYFIF